MFKKQRDKSKININSLISASQNKFENIDIKKDEVTLLIQDCGISILDVLLFNTDQYIKQLYITTFRIGKKDLDILNKLKQVNIIGDITLLISDSVRAMTKGAFNHIESLGFNFKELNTHTKMMFIEKENGERVNCFSSGNFNPDGKIEQLEFNYNKNEFSFYEDWIKNI